MSKSEEIHGDDITFDFKRAIFLALRIDYFLYEYVEFWLLSANSARFNWGLDPLANATQIVVFGLISYDEQT